MMVWIVKILVHVKDYIFLSVGRRVLFFLLNQFIQSTKDKLLGTRALELWNRNNNLQSEICVRINPLNLTSVCSSVSQSVRKAA